MKDRPTRIFLEPLEDRIAPAALTNNDFQSITVGSPYLLTAGHGISTADVGGQWLLYVQKGEAFIFTTDLNGNGKVDANEITGISAGNGLRLLSFVDIHGDIVTNLGADGFLTDSTPGTPDRDGLIVLPSKIEAITLRSVAQSDLAPGDIVTSHIAPSSYSIYGSIFAGGGFGVAGGGLSIDTSGVTLQGAGESYGLTNVIPHIGAIRVGTAVSNQFFTFGVGNVNFNSITHQWEPAGVYGTLKAFTPAAGVAGADIIGVFATNNPALTTTDPLTGQPVSTQSFSVAELVAGDGGFGARGGNIQNIALNGNPGGIHIQAGNGGIGEIGGAGGSITNLSDSFLNISSFGSLIGHVDIHTGSGGAGLLGAGGTAGTLKLGTFNATGDINIVLGDGGSGITSGGNGGGFSTGLVTPGQPGEAPNAGLLVTTYRNIGDIGSPNVIDFNHDGFADFVFVGTNPDELGVAYGDGHGGISHIDYLPSQLYNDVADPQGGSIGLTIVNFGTSGSPQLGIVTASNSQSTFGGLYTYLWNPTANNNIGGFDAPIHSPLPFMDQTTPSVNPILDLVSGDFNHDGKMDVALITQPVLDNITFMAVASGVGNGLFYINYGVIDHVQTIPNSIVTLISGQPTTKILATAAQRGIATSEILLTSYFDGQNAAIQPYTMDTHGLIAKGGAPNALFQDRDSLGVPTGPAKPSPLQDFVVLHIAADPDPDTYDVVSLNSGATSILSTFKGSTDGTLASGASAGIYLNTNDGIFAPANTLGIYIKLTAAPDGSTFGGGANLEVYDIGTSTVNTVLRAANVTDFAHASYVPSADLDEVNGNAIVLASVLNPISKDQSHAFIEAYRPDVSSGNFGVLYTYPVNGLSTTVTGVSTETGLAAFSLGIQMDALSFTLKAGDGGNSILGAGGSGGVVGSQSTTSPLSISPGIFANLTSGNGGNGFTTGGNGGKISGITGTIADLTSGNGGSGIQKGGSGGDILPTTISGGKIFIAGNGGNGPIGGNGGSIIGQGSIAAPDNVENGITATAGNGGTGISSGGKGGSIQNFFPLFTSPDSPYSADYILTAGNGGNAIGGTGGVGGSLINDNPVTINPFPSPPSPGNLFSQAIFFTAGNGGGGLTGGAGGSITKFINSPSPGYSPTALSFIAGNGGGGVLGNGGVGGAISSVTVSGVGFALGDGLNFVRFIAGNGGLSFGAKGGNGGSINNLQTSSTSSSAAIAAGAGGDGVTSGGAGGSLISVVANAGTTPQGSKVLAIAGAGGNAYGVTAATLAAQRLSQPTFADTIFSFGASSGIGGNGGNIQNFTQGGSVLVSTDLIAGNGGNVMSYGSPALSTVPVGTGGSITNVNLIGSTGRIDDQGAVAIKSYNNTAAGQSVANFVQTTLAATPDIMHPLNLTDADGNSGVIAGISGRMNVLSGTAIPSPTGKNGSVSNLSAHEGIMSMIAGSVDRISGILSISGITSGTGVYGAYKNNPIAHDPAGLPVYYLDSTKTTTVNNAAVGGALMDGAIVSYQTNGMTGKRIFPV
ncbi:MAG: hypothetical protein ABI443_01710 [Chthoniobacterales bacterium]